MTVDTAMVLAAMVLVMLWPIHQQLTIRALRHSLHRQHTSLHQQRRAIIQLQTIVTGLPTSSYQPMATVGSRAIEHDEVLPAQPRRNVRRLAISPLDDDQTLRLARPPALSDVEGVLHLAGRDLTATEMATQLDRRPWDLLPDIDHLVRAGKIETVPGHTAGRTAYRLADSLRMVAR